MKEFELVQSFFQSFVLHVVVTLVSFHGDLQAVYTKSRKQHQPLTIGCVSSDSRFLMHPQL